MQREHVMSEKAKTPKRTTADRSASRAAQHPQPVADRGALPPHPVLQLHDAIGNRALAGLIQAKSAGPDQRRPDAGDVEIGAGMPGPLKAGLEALSGMDLSGVRVHKNSSKPAQLNALAYTQGQDIHVGPGQEEHLPHEGWHAVQQMQGRVQPTIQANGVSINDDAGLEREADVMGSKASRFGYEFSGVHIHTDSTAQADEPPSRSVAWAGVTMLQRSPEDEEKEDPSGGFVMEPEEELGAAEHATRADLAEFDEASLDELFWPGFYAEWYGLLLRRHEVAERSDAIYAQIPASVMAKLESSSEILRWAWWNGAILEGMLYVTVRRAQSRHSGAGAEANELSGEAATLLDRLNRTVDLTEVAAAFWETLIGAGVVEFAAAFTGASIAYIGKLSVLLSELEPEVKRAKKAWEKAKKHVKQAKIEAWINIGLEVVTKFVTFTNPAVIALLAVAKTGGSILLDEVLGPDDDSVAEPVNTVVGNAAEWYGDKGTTKLMTGAKALGLGSMALGMYYDKKEIEGAEALLRDAEVRLKEVARRYYEILRHYVTARPVLQDLHILLRRLEKKMKALRARAVQLESLHIEHYRKTRGDVEVTEEDVFRHGVDMEDPEAREILEDEPPAVQRKVEGSDPVIQRTPDEEAVAAPELFPIEVLESVAQGNPERSGGHVGGGSAGGRAYDLQPDGLKDVLAASRGDPAAWYEGLDSARRGSLTMIYNRLSRYGLWRHVKTIRGIEAGESPFDLELAFIAYLSGAPSFHVDGLTESVLFVSQGRDALFNALYDSGRFCADTGIGGSLHADQISMREASDSDSLHIAIGPGDLFDAHIDRYASVSEIVGLACTYDVVGSAKHLGREVFSEKLRAVTGIPGGELLPEPGSRVGLPEPSRGGAAPPEFIRITLRGPREAERGGGRLTEPEGEARGHDFDPATVRKLEGKRRRAIAAAHDRLEMVRLAAVIAREVSPGALVPADGRREAGDYADAREVASTLAALMLQAVAADSIKVTLNLGDAYRGLPAESLAAVLGEIRRIALLVKSELPEGGAPVSAALIFFGASESHVLAFDGGT